MAGIRTRNRLKALSVEKESTPGTYADGGGLSLVVTDAGAKKWELRIAVGGRRRQLGLGVYPSVSLEEARSKATQIRWAASEGRDMVSEEKQAERLAAAPPRSITFRAAFDGYFEMKEQQLSNEKHKVSEMLRTRARLVSAVAVAETVRAYHEEMNRQNQPRPAQAEVDHKAPAQIVRAIAGLVTVEDGLYQPTVKAPLAEPERQKARARSKAPR